MLFMRKRIGLANGIMKESARAINAVPLLVLMPVFETIGMVAFFIPFIYYGKSVYTHIYMHVHIRILHCRKNCYCCGSGSGLFQDRLFVILTVCMMDVHTGVACGNCVYFDVRADMLDVMLLYCYIHSN
jgi:Plasma-membrane choline transporter